MFGVFGVFGYSAQPMVTKFAHLIVAVYREIGKFAKTAVRCGGGWVLGAEQRWWESWCVDIHWQSGGGSLALVCVLFFVFVWSWYPLSAMTSASIRYISRYIH